MATNGSPKGTKKGYAREALEDLGISTTYAPARAWVQKKYGVDLAEPTFYVVRKEMQQEAQSQGGTAPAKVSESRTAAPTAPAKAKSAAPKSQKPARGGAAASAGASAQEEGVAEMVLKAKDLIERLGKEEAKRLIDAL